MNKKIVMALFATVAVLSFALVTTDNKLWSQGSVGQNLQVLEFSSKIELQTYMKGLTDALGVQCKYCHDLKDFSADIPELHKDEAREMMKMTAEINENWFKDKPDHQMNCFVCHRGREHPVYTPAEWSKILEEESK